MAIRKDGTGKRWVEMELIAQGTPEQVWHAMATGPGNSAWFTNATIEERAGGTVRFDFGDQGTSTGEVTAWEPPRRFGYIERDWSPGAPPVATEITIEARAGGTCVIRMVHSLFTSRDDWDDQLESFESGWPSFFAVLQLYLAHFAGMPGASIGAVAVLEGDQQELWKRLAESAGVDGANVGERRANAGDPEPLAGVIERVQQDQTGRFVAMRLESPSPGVALFATQRMTGKIYANVSIYFYGEDAAARAAASDARWKAWLHGVGSFISTSEC
jgi:activator of Hsp90 ATPase-like protein